jgi:hypothetical protein
MKKDWRMIIYTSHYDSWPMINLCSIEKPKTDISFILEKVHQEKEHIHKCQHMTQVRNVDIYDRKINSNLGCECQKKLTLIIK